MAIPIPDPDPGKGASDATFLGKIWKPELKGRVLHEADDGIIRCACSEGRIQ